MKSRNRKGAAALMALALVLAMACAAAQPARAADVTLTVYHINSGDLYDELNNEMTAYGASLSAVNHLEIVVSAGVNMTGEAYDYGSDWHTLAYINDNAGSGKVKPPGMTADPVTGLPYTYLNLPGLNKLTVRGIGSVPSFALSPNVPGDMFYQGPTWLRTLVLPDATVLEAEALSLNLAMITLDIPAVREIRYHGVRACNNLSSINMPAVETIGANAFQLASGTGSLRQVTLPASLRSIGDRAFGRITTLEQVTFQGSTPPVIAGSDGIFYTDSGSVKSNVKIIVPSGAEQAYANALYPTHIAAVSQINNGQLDPTTPTYTMTQRPSEANGYTAIVNAPYSTFTGVSIDGMSLTSGIHYNAYSSDNGQQTVMTLHTSYINTLTQGSHNITINFTGGASSETFTVYTSIQPTLSAPPPVVIITDDANAVNPDFLEQVMEIEDYNVAESAEEEEVEDVEEDLEDIDDFEPEEEDDGLPEEPPEEPSDYVPTPTPTSTATPVTGIAVILAILAVSMLLLAKRRKQQAKRSEMW